MVKIHGIVYIILGLFLSIVSFILNLNNKNNKFTLFLVIGFLMLILGFVKSMPLLKKKRQK